jgi:hypothetical protein
LAIWRCGWMQTDTSSGAGFTCKVSPREGRRGLRTAH